VFGLNVLLGEFGAVVLAVMLAAGLVLRRRRSRRAAATVTLEDVAEPSATTYWGGAEWPRIVVRSHGRLRDVGRRPRPADVVAIPMLSPWEPPQSS
jgi:hypothetical protein